MPIDERSQKQFKSPADASQSVNIVQPGTPTEKNVLKKHIDNPTHDELTGNQFCSDDTLKHSGRAHEELSINKHESNTRPVSYTNLRANET